MTGVAGRDWPGDDDTIAPMSGLSIDQRSMSGEWQVLEIAGEVDLATVGDVERAVKSVFDDGASALALDLSGTTFMDSTGLRTLVVADRQFREEGRPFAVVVQPGPITRLMDLSGLDSSLTIVGSLEDLS